MVNDVTKEEFIDYLLSKDFQDIEKGSGGNILKKYLDSYTDGSEPGNIGIQVWLKDNNNHYEIKAFIDFDKLFPETNSIIKNIGRSYGGINPIKDFNGYYDLDRFDEVYSEMKNNLKEALSLILKLDVKFSDE